MQNLNLKLKRFLALVPCNPLAGKPCEFKHLGELLVGIFDWLIGLAALVAVLMIVWGGFRMLEGWFEENPEGAWKDGVLTIRRALWGLVLVAGAFLVVDTLLRVLFKIDGGVNGLLQSTKLFG